MNKSQKYSNELKAEIAAHLGTGLSAQELDILSGQYPEVLPSTLQAWNSMVRHGKKIFKESETIDSNESKISKAKEIILEMLTAKDFVAQNVIFEKCKDFGISESTANRAKKQLRDSGTNIKSTKLHHIWFWSFGFDVLARRNKKIFKESETIPQPEYDIPDDFDGNENNSLGEETETAAHYHDIPDDYENTPDVDVPDKNEPESHFSRALKEALEFIDSLEPKVYRDLEELKAEVSEKDKIITAQNAIIAIQNGQIKLYERYCDEPLPPLPPIKEFEEIEAEIQKLKEIQAGYSPEDSHYGDITEAIDLLDRLSDLTYDMLLANHGLYVDTLVKADNQAKNVLLAIFGAVGGIAVFANLILKKRCKK